MKIKKYLISAMAIFLMGSMVACQSKPAENKKAEGARFISLDNNIHNL